MKGKAAGKGKGKIGKSKKTLLPACANPWCEMTCHSKPEFCDKFDGHCCSKCMVFHYARLTGTLTKSMKKNGGMLGQDEHGELCETKLYKSQ